MTAQAGAVAALLPCPFCGATPVPSKTCIECDSCGTEGPVYMAGLIGAPVTQWNKRAATPAAVPVEALEGLVEEWREASDTKYPRGMKAREMSPEVRYEVEGRCEQMDACADELTQLIKERSNG